MKIIDEYLNKIQDSLDTPDLCNPGFKWNPQLQRCVPLGDGENEDFVGDK